MFHKAGAFAADAPGFMACLRESAPFRSAVDSLKAGGILRQDLAPDGIRDIHVGRAFTMGMLYQRLGEPSRARGTSRPAGAQPGRPSRERLPDRSADDPRVPTSRRVRSLLGRTTIRSATERRATISRAAASQPRALRLSSGGPPAYASARPAAGAPSDAYAAPETRERCRVSERARRRPFSEAPR
jgi:hypothetical protein